MLERPRLQNSRNDSHRVDNFRLLVALCRRGFNMQPVIYIERVTKSCACVYFWWEKLTTCRTRAAEGVQTMTGITAEMFQFANVEAKRSPLGLFNDVINTGCLESSWRHAMFVMWPKSGDWPDVNTWRPIARLKIKDDFFFQCFTCGSLSRQTTIYNRGWQLSLSLGLSSRLSPALCPSSGLVAVSASLGLSPTSSPILSPSWSRMLCQLFRFFPYLELFFHIVWDVAFAFLGFPPSFSSVLSPILCEMPCPPCCPSACLRHLSLSLSPVLCPSSHLVFHFVFHLRCSVPSLIPCRSGMLCLPLVSGLVSHLCSQLV